MNYDCFPVQRAERIPISVPLTQEIAEEIHEKLKQTQHVSFPKDYWRDRAWDEEVKHQWTADGKVSFSDEFVSGKHNSALHQTYMEVKRAGCGNAYQILPIIMCCANADGSHQLKPLMVGKFMKPRSFKSIKN